MSNLKKQTVFAILLVSSFFLAPVQAAPETSGCYAEMKKKNKLPAGMKPKSRLSLGELCDYRLKNPAKARELVKQEKLCVFLFPGFANETAGRGGLSVYMVGPENVIQTLRAPASVPEVVARAWPGVKPKTLKLPSGQSVEDAAVSSISQIRKRMKEKGCKKWIGYCHSKGSSTCHALRNRQLTVGDKNIGKWLQKTNTSTYMDAGVLSSPGAPIAEVALGLSKNPKHRRKYKKRREQWESFVKKYLKENPKKRDVIETATEKLAGIAEKLAGEGIQSLSGEKTRMRNGKTLPSSSLPPCYFSTGRPKKFTGVSAPMGVLDEFTQSLGFTAGDGLVPCESQFAKGCIWANDHDQAHGGPNWGGMGSPKCQRGFARYQLDVMLGIASPSTGGSGGGKKRRR